MADMGGLEEQLAEAVSAAKKANNLPAAPAGGETDLDKLLDQLKARGTDLPLSLDPEDLEGIEAEAEKALIDPKTGQVKISPMAHKCVVLAMQGFGFAQIARMLGVSSSTVASYLKSEAAQKRIAAIMWHVEQELTNMQLLAVRRLHMALTCGDGKVELEAIKLILGGKLKGMNLTNEAEKTAEDTVKDIMAALQQRVIAPDGSEITHEAQVRVIDSKSRRKIIDAMPIGEERERERVLGKRSA